MTRKIILSLLITLPLTVLSQNVTLHSVNQPAASVFRSIIEQTGKNFVYPSELLSDMKVSVNVKNKPLKSVLKEMFSGTDIDYKIKGNNVILKRKHIIQSHKPKRVVKTTPEVTLKINPKIDTVTMLDEVIILSRLEASSLETAEIGARKITADEVRSTPALFGEVDVIKALQYQPGVSDGTEGLAGMYVHGGNADENLYMLDNVPIYQVNHFAGLFSAFNTDIIRYIDFFKSSFPAKYDGRLSSFMDVRLQNGSKIGHHGSARLGLTSGAFNISGPIGKNTTYLFGLRRSWFDVLSIPMLAIVNSGSEEKTRLHYYFMDLNAKVSHRFSDRTNGFVSIYFGDDMLHSGYEDKYEDSYEKENYDYHWGNLVAQAGMNYRLSPILSAEFTAAYTRYFSNMKSHDIYRPIQTDEDYNSEDWMRTDNNINDWIFRGDFDWQPNDDNRVRFGLNYVRHSFLPCRTSRKSVSDTSVIEAKDSTYSYGANEVNAYIEDDWRLSDKVRINAGVHASLFNIERSAKHGISPRLSMNYRPDDNFAVKAAYSRTVQYVHQLTQSYLSLPSDQWTPVTGYYKPQSADKIAAGIYWQPGNNLFTISIEGYYKWMHNLIDFCDEYYLRPPLEMWNARLTQGNGSAKGIDVMIEKLSGKITGHVSYSLSWADRKFPDKNGGATYPARFDNRHTINILLNWNINDKVSLSASWTGHSGNRFTLLPQSWDTPDFDNNYSWVEEAPLRTSINNYQLPFYHRLDLSCTVRNSHGYWNFGLYNAYNHMNVIGIRRSYNNVRPVFQKIKLLPIIPSISYTWEF